MEGGHRAPECPMCGPESSARISERGPEFNGRGRRQAGRLGLRLGQAGPGGQMLEMRRGNAGAIAAPHQHAVLGLAQVRNAHGEPNSDRYQGGGKSEGCNVRQHAPAKVVRFAPLSLIARQIIRLVRSVVPRSLAAGVFRPARRVSRRSRSPDRGYIRGLPAFPA